MLGNTTSLQKYVHTGSIVVRLRKIFLCDPIIHLAFTAEHLFDCDKV